MVRTAPFTMKMNLFLFQQINGNDSMTHNHVNSIASLWCFAQKEMEHNSHEQKEDLQDTLDQFRQHINFDTIDSDWKNNKPVEAV